MRTFAASASFLFLVLPALSQRPATTVDSSKYFYGKNAATKVLRHVRVIDGTGAAVKDDQTVVIEGTKITAIGTSASLPSNAEIIDLAGYTVLPGLVGMHDHIYYLQRPNTDAQGSEGPTLLPQMTFSAPRMYLANGVTTIRTAKMANCGGKAGLCCPCWPTTN